MNASRVCVMIVRRMFWGSTEEMGVIGTEHVFSVEYSVIFLWGDSSGMRLR